jgi:dolichyl-phosphate-mannose--protein O-mannosyl transferase
VLPNSGPGDGFMSSAFQTRLKGNALYRMENPRGTLVYSIGRMLRLAQMLHAACRARPLQLWRTGL